MGKKVVAIISALTVLAMCCSLCGSIVATHKVSFSTAYGLLYRVRFETNLLTAEIKDTDTNLFCYAVNSLSPGTCHSGTYMLQEFSQRFCAPVVAQAYPQACTGFQMAYLLGMITLVVLVLNAMLCITGLWLLNHYINSENHKKSYREIALVCFLIGTVLLAGTLVVYGLFVFQSLNDMRPRGAGVWGELVFKPSEGLGIYWGYIILMLNVVVQVVIMALVPFAKTSQEQGKDELEERKFAQQIAMEPGYGGAGSQGQPQQPGGAQAQAGFPMQQPLPQPAYGAYGTPGGW